LHIAVDIWVYVAVQKFKPRTFLRGKMRRHFGCLERFLAEIDRDQIGVFHRLLAGRLRKKLLIFYNAKRQRQIMLRNTHTYPRRKAGNLKVHIVQFHAYALAFQKTAKGYGFFVGVDCNGNVSHRGIKLEKWLTIKSLKAQFKELLTKDRGVFYPAVPVCAIPADYSFS